MEYHFSGAGQTAVVTVERAGQVYTVTVNGCAFTVNAGVDPRRPGELALSLDGRRVLAFVAADGARRWVALETQADRPFVLGAPDSGRPAHHGPAGGHNTLEAQMPGVVRRVLVAVGDHVERGQALVLLEAMKMEIRVGAPFAGIVDQVAVAEGQAVERGQTLVDLLEQA